MSLLYRTILRPVVFLQDSEKAHSRILSVLSGMSRSRLSLSLLGNLYRSPELPVSFSILIFPNPIGVAAGMDKNGSAVPSWQSIGYGFCEIGGVTLREQPGNPKPRMFRVTKDKALINRMGFNNIGANALQEKITILERQRSLARFASRINLGKSKVTPLEKLLQIMLAQLRYYGSMQIFFVINVSSPNTPGLRDLQESKNLETIIKKCCEINKECSDEEGITEKPLLVKIAPELNEGF